MLAHLQEAVNASGEVIFMTDRGGTFTFVNRQFERLYGYRSEEVVGRMTPRILKSGAMSADAYQSFWSRVHQGETVEVEFANRTRDGRLLDVEATVSPIVDRSLEVVGFLAIQRDVSARRQAVEALQIAEERMRFAMQNAGVGTWEMDYATGVMKWSPLIETHYGLQPARSKTRSTPSSTAFIPTIAPACSRW